MTSINFHNETVYINKLWYDSHKDIIKKVARELDAGDKINELITKFLGDELKIKKHKDPNRPKKPKSGFLYFCDDTRSEIRKQNPSFTMPQIMKELGKQWSSYTDEQKEVYNIRYREAKDIYDDTIEEYNLNNY